MFNDYDDLLTIEELCAILLIGKNAAYTLLKTKQIKAFRIGRGEGSEKICGIIHFKSKRPKQKIKSP